MPMPRQGAQPRWSRQDGKNWRAPHPCGAFFQPGSSTGLAGARAVVSARMRDTTQDEDATQPIVTGRLLEQGELQESDARGTVC
jgi:hypothetical protein